MNKAHKIEFLSAYYIWNCYDQTLKKLFCLQHVFRNMFHVKQMNKSRG